MKKHIHAMAVCLIENNGKLLLNKGFDNVKNETFYRLIGGHIEFGEKAVDTIKREILEELRVEIFNLEFVTAVEEIFVYQGNKGHEVIFIYKGNLKDEKILNSDLVPNPDSPDFPAVWVPVTLVKSEALRVSLTLYP